MNPVIDRIRKLRAHAAGTSNSAEAEAFAAKAAELMIRHQIGEMDLLEAEGRADEALPIGFRRINLSQSFGINGETRLPTWIQTLVLGVAKVSTCRVVRNQREQELMLIGQQSDTEIAMYLCESLVRQGKDAARRYCQQVRRELGGLPPKARQSFLFGFVRRVIERMQAAKNDVIRESNGHALIVLDKVERAVIRATQRATGTDGAGKQRRDTLNGACVADGMVAGDRALLHRGIGTPTGPTRPLLN